MTSVNEVEHRLIDLLARCAFLEASQLAPTASLSREIELDSMSAIAFQCDIEADFDLDFPIERLIELDTIANIAAVLVGSIPSEGSPS